MKKRYLGIDESNHGRYPEVFVGVCSSFDSDITPTRLSKHRVESSIEKIIGQREWAYCLVPAIARKFLDAHSIRIMAFVELVTYFKNNNKHDSLDLILIDGDATAFELRKTLELSKVKGETNIRAGKDGDRIYNLVNMADYVAWHLFHIYSRKRHSEKLSLYESDNMTRLINEDIIKQYAQCINFTP